MDKVEIINHLKGIFLRYFNIAEEFKEENYDKTLTGYFLLSYFDLTYIYILIEDQYNISIKNKKLENYGLNTINNIINLVSETIII